MVKCLALSILSVAVTVFIAYSTFGNGGLPRVVDSYANLSIGPRGNIPFPRKIVHLDLKGAPPKISYFQWFFPFLASLGITGLLIEYEDMFPYSGRLANITRLRGHYSFAEIEKINELAETNGLEIIPLVQTFGHMEFVLKQPEFSDLSENTFEDDSICVSDPSSMDLIREMIRQVKQAHPRVRRIHIGSDEVYHVGEDARCGRELKKLGKEPQKALEMLKIRHIARVALLCRELNFTEVFAWNDMFDKTEVDDLTDMKLGSLITPVVWGYASNVLKEGYFPEGLFRRLGQIFDRIWFASAFKGANGKDQAFMSIDRYLQNHKSYVELYKTFSQDLEGKVQGIILTGWQRFQHRLPLSELLPVAIPSLVMNSIYLNNVLRPFKEINRATKSRLECSGASFETIFASMTIENHTYFPEKDTLFTECSFRDQYLYKLVMKDLRFLTWKFGHFTMDVRYRRELQDELHSLTLKLETALSSYYEESDVDEILAQYLGPLKQLL